MIGNSTFTSIVLDDMCQRAVLLDSLGSVSWSILATDALTAIKDSYCQPFSVYASRCLPGGNRPPALAGALRAHAVLQIHPVTSPPDNEFVSMTAVTLLGYPFLAADCGEVVTYNGEEVKRQCVAKSFACESLLARLGTRTPLKLMNEVANVIVCVPLPFALRLLKF